MAVNPFTRSLDSIVDITVQVSPMAAARPTFNQALILGQQTVIPISERLREYNSLAEMATDGFAITDPEYLAASLYFAQSPAPDTLWVGRQDLTSIKTFELGSSAGTGYSIGDTLTVVQSGASGGTVKVKTVGASGDITALETTMETVGTGYSVANSLATTVSPSGGTGATFDVLTVGDTPLSALMACRAANFSWYVCMSCQAVTADHKDIALWVESATPSTVYFFTTDDADVPLGTADNIFDYLRDRSYSRTLGQYSTDATLGAYAVAAIMGYAMGQNTGLANSAYTLKFKQEVGIDTEDLTSTQISNIENANGNLYLSYADYYTIFEQGKMANGRFFDEIINLDMLVSDIQLGVMDLLYQNPKIPQTDAGVTQIVHAINVACELSVTRGFLAPGTWTGVSVLNLNTDDYLPKGYLVQTTALADQSAADREARKCPPIYVCIKEAGAIHSVTIEVRVNR